MKSILIAVVLVMFTVSSALSMGLFMELLGDDNGDDTPSQDKALVGYEWEDSDSVTDKSYIMLQSSMSADTITIDDRDFKYGGKSNTGREYWYGDTKHTFPGNVDIKVEAKDGFTYSSNVNNTVTEPPPPPPIDDGDDPPSNVPQSSFHHTQTDGPDGGQSLVLCPGQVKFDRCTVAGHNLRYHAKDDTNRHAYWEPRNWYETNIICTKGGKKYTFPTNKNANRGLVWGKCN